MISCPLVVSLQIKIAIIGAKIILKIVNKLGRFISLSGKRE